MSNFQPTLWSQFNNNLKRSLSPTNTTVTDNQSNPKKKKILENEKSLKTLLNPEEEDSNSNWSQKLDLILLGCIIQFSINSNKHSPNNSKYNIWERIVKKFKNNWLVESEEGLLTEINIKFIKEKFKILINFKINEIELIDNIDDAINNPNYLMNLFKFVGNLYIDRLKHKIDEVQGEIDDSEGLTDTQNIVDAPKSDNITTGSQEDKEGNESSDHSEAESNSNMEIDDEDNNSNNNDIDINMDISMGEGEVVELAKNSPKGGDKVIDDPGEDIVNEGSSSSSNGEGEDDSENQKEDEEEFFTPKESSIDELDQNKVDPIPKEDDDKEAEESDLKPEQEPLDIQDEEAQKQESTDEAVQVEEGKPEDTEGSIIDVDLLESGPEISEPIIIDDQSMNIEGVSEIILDDDGDEKEEEKDKTASDNDIMDVSESEVSKEEENEDDPMEIDLPEIQTKEPTQDNNNIDMMEVDDLSAEIHENKDDEEVQVAEILPEESDEIDVDENETAQAKEQTEDESDDKEGDEDKDESEAEVQTKLKSESKTESEAESKGEEEADDDGGDKMKLDPALNSDKDGGDGEEDKAAKEEEPNKLEEKGQSKENEEDPSYISNELSELTNLTNLEMSELTEPTTLQDITLDKSLSSPNSEKKSQDEGNEIEIDLEEGKEFETEGKPEELSSNQASSLAASPSNQFQPQPTPSTATGGSRDSNRIKQLLLFNWNQLSTHKYANMFQNPIKEANAPDYYRLIKQPMDLNTIKANIRNQKITNIDEFHLNLLIMCYNAIMFNKEDTEIFNRGLELLKSCEEVIQQLRVTNKIE